MVSIKAFDPGAVGKLLRDFLFMQEARTLQAEPVKAHFKCRLLDMYSESSLGFQAVNAVSCKDGQVSAPPPPRLLGVLTAKVRRGRASRC